MGKILVDSDLKELRKQAVDLIDTANNGEFGEVTGEEVAWASACLDLLDDITVRKALHVDEQRRSADRLRIALDAIETHIPDPKAREKALEAIAKVGVG